MTEHVREHFRHFLKNANLDHKQYQEDGVVWCVNNETRPDPPYGLRGGLIADEMGLGKTITMIATIICNPNPNKKPTLVVLPCVLLEQWAQTIRQLTGHTPCVYHGTLNKKSMTREKLESSWVVITTYAAISVQKIKKNKRLMVVTNTLHEIQWGRIVFDEAHHMRNKNTGRNIGAKLLLGDVRWLLSGTPIQNNKHDLYALCSILGLPARVYADTEKSAQIAAHFLLKRTKKQAGICLPDTICDQFIVPWKINEERNLSAKVHSLLPCYKQGQIIDDKPLDLKNTQPLQLFIRAKQCCVLPSLLKDAIFKENITIHAAGLGGTSKLDALLSTLIERKDNGNGKLVFCHFREEINLIALRLQHAGISNVAILDGRHSILERNKIIASDFQVLILQIQTACEGLNLQKNYSEVYFVTPHWNPTIEDQAIARCHRIGQLKPVFVFRFQMEHFDKKDDCLMSFDQYVSIVQERKKRDASLYFPV